MTLIYPIILNSTVDGRRSTFCSTLFAPYGCKDMIFSLSLHRYDN